MENRQTKNSPKNEKFECFSLLDDFSFAGCTQSSKFERLMIVQTHAYDGGNRECFLFKSSNLH